MGLLDSKARANLPKSSFGLPGSKSYPMPDAAHAANAKQASSFDHHHGATVHQQGKAAKGHMMPMPAKGKGC